MEKSKESNYKKRIDERERENSDDRHSRQSCWLLQKCHFKNFVSVCSEPKQESLKSNPD